MLDARHFHHRFASTRRGILCTRRNIAEHATVVAMDHAQKRYRRSDIVGMRSSGRLLRTAYGHQNSSRTWRSSVNFTRRSYPSRTLSGDLQWSRHLHGLSVNLSFEVRDAPSPFAREGKGQGFGLRRGINCRLIRPRSSPALVVAAFVLIGM